MRKINTVAGYHVELAMLLSLVSRVCALRVRRKLKWKVSFVVKYNYNTSSAVATD